jgi:hypothetical protein
LTPLLSSPLPRLINLNPSRSLRLLHINKFSPLAIPIGQRFPSQFAPMIYLSCCALSSIRSPTVHPPSYSITLQNPLGFFGDSSSVVFCFPFTISFLLFNHTQLHSPSYCYLYQPWSQYCKHNPNSQFNLFPLLFSLSSRLPNVVTSSNIQHSTSTSKLPTSTNVSSLYLINFSNRIVNNSLPSMRYQLSSTVGSFPTLHLCSFKLSHLHVFNDTRTGLNLSNYSVYSASLNRCFCFFNSASRLSTSRHSVFSPLLNNLFQLQFQSVTKLSIPIPKSLLHLTTSQPLSNPSNLHLRSLTVTLARSTPISANDCTNRR